MLIQKNNQELYRIHSNAFEEVLLLVLVVFVFDVKEVGYPTLDASLKDPIIYDMNTIRYYLSVHDNGAGKLSFNSDYEFIPNKEISLEDYKAWATKMLQAFETKTLINPEEIKNKNKEISDRVGAMKTKEEIAKEVNLSSENFPLFINDYKPGNLTVKKQVLNGDKDKFFEFKLKIGNISEELPEGEFKMRAEPEEGKVELGRYDDMAFFGEVSGKNLIAHEDLIKLIDDNNKDRGVKIGGAKPKILRDGYEEIYDKNEKEEERGGIWLKFVDHRQDCLRDGKPRTFYVMKKPIRKGVSWNTLFDAGVVYGWDVIDENTGLPKSNPKKYKNIGNYGTKKDYKATILTIKGKKYIVRLLQGKTNYGGDVTNTKFYERGDDNANSEWNRTILPITQGYRFGVITFEDAYAEQALKDGDFDSYYKRNYNVQLANYNWFGDLTLCAWDDWHYNNKKYNYLDNLGTQGQGSWTQEFCESSNSRSIRGRGHTNYGAAASDNEFPNFDVNRIGVRLVIEPYEAEE